MVASPAGTLYGPRGSFRTQRVLIASKYGGSDVNLDGNFKIGAEHGDEFQKKFALGKIPSFEGKDGLRLVGATAVSTHVARSFAGSDEATRAQVLQWLDIADNDFLPAVLGYVLPALSYLDNHRQSVEKAHHELSSLLRALNEYLLTRTYLVAERISLADVSLALNLRLAYENVLDEAARKPFGNVTRWFLTVFNQPNVTAVTGDVHLCQTPAVHDPRKFAAHQKEEGKGDGHGKGKKHHGGHGHGHGHGHGGDAKGKKEEAKKDTPKKETTAGEDDGPDATEAALAAEPKSKDPFAELPKTNFNFDEFKRVYSNEDTLTKAIPYFWDHFDPATMSVWYCEYKYPDELTLTFMSCNLIGGMMQRLDKMRKNSFGSMILFGADNNSTISGVWFWRGDQLAFELSDDLKIDYGSYEWKKLDTSDPAVKKLVNEYLAWEGDFDGKKFNQGKIFK